MTMITFCQFFFYQLCSVMEEKKHNLLPDMCALVLFNGYL